MWSTRKTILYFIIVIILLILAAMPYTCLATSKYVTRQGYGRDAADAGATREDPMNFPYFINTYASPGDVALCQPGNYGGFEFIGEGGVANVGTAGHHIVIMADPATCTPRSPDWATRSTILESPDPTKHAVFTNIRFRYFRKSGDWSDPDSYYITLKNLWIDGETTNQTGFLYFNYTLADVNVVDCSIFAHQPENQYASQATAYCVGFGSSANSGIKNVIIDGLYTSGGTSAFTFQSALRGDVTLKNSHLFDTHGSAIQYVPSGYVVYNDANFYCTNNYIEGYECVADEAKTATNLANSPLITAVDEGEPRRIFQVASCTALSSSWYSALMVYDNSSSTYTAMRFLQDDYTVNASTRWVTLTNALDFDIEVGVDKCRMMDINHGSGFSIRGPRFIARDCIVKNVGSTRLCNIYVNDLDWIQITNCLFINTINVNTIWFASTGVGVGDHFRFTNNTVLGNIWNASSYAAYNTLHQAYNAYGHGVTFGFSAGCDTSTCEICNNLIVGYTSLASAGDAVIRNNIIYYNASPTQIKAGGTDPLNKRNVAIYAGEAWGEEPHPFHKAGSYFVATNADFDDLTYNERGRGNNLAYDYTPKEGAATIDASDANTATATDLFGGGKSGVRDIGAIEYGATSPTAPSMATTPSPADGAVGRPISQTLSWTTGTNSPTHHVYFGTDLDAMTNGTGGTDKDTQAGTTYDPGILEYTTTYYWRIDEEKTGEDTAAGDVWEFQTKTPPTPKYGLIGRKK